MATAAFMATGAFKTMGRSFHGSGSTQSRIGIKGLFTETGAFMAAEAFV